MTDSLAIVGAGAAGTGAAYALRDAAVDVTVFEKRRGVCGRAATRRREGCRYDHGANFVAAHDERVTRLLTEDLDTEGLVDIDAPVWTVDGDGAVTERDEGGPRYTYAEGITGLAERLLDRTAATVHRETRVVEPVRTDGGWRLYDGDGADRGRFDALLLTPPAPQTADLLGNANWEHALCRDLRETVAVVPFRPVLTAVLHYPFELDVPFYALRNDDGSHAFGWVSREECKDGHVPDGESLLVVQGNPDWSVDHFDAAGGETTAVAADVVADLLDDARLADPDWTDTQHWRYAAPEGPVDRGALADAAAHDLYFAGDWVAGEGRVHAALRNGLEAGERIAE